MHSQAPVHLTVVAGVLPARAFERTRTVVRYVFSFEDGTDVLVAVGHAHNHPSLPVESSRLTFGMRAAVADAVKANPNHTNRTIIGTFHALVHDSADGFLTAFILMRGHARFACSCDPRAGRCSA